jgi:uncharacterized membrane protein YqjE
MPDILGGGQQVLATSRGLALQFLTIAENRLALVAVEVQEERNRLLHACLLALAIAGCALLALITLTAAVVVACWAWSPLGVLAILATAYAGAVATLGWLLARRLAQWHSFAASIDQLRKDRVCISEILA